MRRVGLIVLFLLAAPTSARAAAVSVVERPGDKSFRASSTLLFDARPGERNVVRIEPVFGGDASVLVIRDAGAPLEPGAGCVRDGDALRCSASSEISAGADLGDGDDSLDVSAGTGGFGPGVVALGGTGDDRLRGGDGRVSFSGGAGDDLLAGGPGNDELSGGDGADILLGGAGQDHLQGDDLGVAPDRIDGGEGDGNGGVSER